MGFNSAFKGLMVGESNK